jgi:hypothetical protein
MMPARLEGGALPIVPKEHGAWAVLLVPLFVGAIAGGGLTLGFILLLCASLLVFMSYLPVRKLARSRSGSPVEQLRLHRSRVWASVYLGTGFVLLAPLIARGYWLLLPIGSAAALLFAANLFLTRRSPRTVPGDLVAVLGLTLTAPAAYYIASHRMDGTAAVIWCLSFLFFGCSVVYVHMKIAAVSTRKTTLPLSEKIFLGRLNIAYHISILLIVGLLTTVHALRSFTILAFLPMAAHAVWGTLRLSSRVSFRNLGFLLLAQSFVFAALFITTH